MSPTFNDEDNTPKARMWSPEEAQAAKDAYYASTGVRYDKTAEKPKKKPAGTNEARIAEYEKNTGKKWKGSASANYTKKK